MGPALVAQRPLKEKKNLGDLPMLYAMLGQHRREKKSLRKRFDSGKAVAYGIDISSSLFGQLPRKVVKAFFGFVFASRDRSIHTFHQSSKVGLGPDFHM